MEGIRRDCDLYSFERYYKCNTVNGEDFGKKYNITSEDNSKAEAILALQTLLDYCYDGLEFFLLKHFGNFFVSSVVYKWISLMLIRDYYIKGKSKEMKIVDSSEGLGIELLKYDVAELLEEILKRYYKYSLSDKDHFPEIVSQITDNDYLLLLFNHSNSISTSLHCIIFINILLDYSYLYFNASLCLSLYRILIINSKDLSNCSFSDDFNYHSLLCLFMGIKIKEYLKVLLSYLTEEKTVEDIIGYVEDTSDGKEIINFEKEMESFKQCCSNKELFVDISLKTLSLFTLIFKYDWKLCLFFSFFVNEKEYIYIFGDDEELKKRGEKVKIVKLFDRKDNDNWLLNRIIGIYDYINPSDNELYLKFECNKECNKNLLKCLKERENFQEVNKNSNVNNFSCIYEENKDNKGFIVNNKEFNNNFTKENFMESSEKMEKQNVSKGEDFSSSVTSKNKLQFFVNSLISLIYSELDDIREYSLLALSSLLDKEKINKEKENEDLYPSIFSMILDSAKESGLFYEIKHTIDICLKEEEMVNEGKNINNKKIEISIFHLFFSFVNSCFDMSIIYDAEKRKEFVINDYVNVGVIKWIASFYEYEEERENVARLLYIIISCLEEEAASSLLNFDESSFFLILLENNENEYLDNMLFLSSIEIIESFLFKRKSMMEEEEFIFFLSFVLLLFNKCRHYYVYQVLMVFLEKYKLLDGDLSPDGIKSLEEELYEYTDRKLNLNTYTSNLSSLSYNFSDFARIKSIGNTIAHNEDKRYESFILNKEMIMVCLKKLESYSCLFII